MIPCFDGSGKANELPRASSLDGSTGSLAGAAAFIVARNNFRTTFHELTDIVIALEQWSHVKEAEGWVVIFLVIVDVGVLEIPAKLELILVEIPIELGDAE